jgi:peptidoglycan hydrolase CwlO-like protein
MAKGSGVAATRLEKRLCQIEKRQTVIQSTFDTLLATIKTVAEQTGHTATKVDQLCCHNCAQVQREASEAKRRALEAKDLYDSKLRELGVGRVERGHSAVIGAVRGG